MTVAPWQLSGRCASLVCGPLEASVDLESPHRGLSNLRIRGAQVDGSLLGVDVVAASATRELAAWEPADFFVRNCDLVAVYPGPQGLPFTLQIYWRAAPWSEGESAGGVQTVLDAIVSVQTRQWEAFPGVVVGSRLPGGERRELRSLDLEGADALVWTGFADWSYLETSRPGDFSPAAPTPTADWLDSRWQFGRQFMERGVIRRLTLRGAICGPQDQAAATRLQAALAAEPPPLTA